MVGLLPPPVEQALTSTSTDAPRASTRVNRMGRLLTVPVSAWAGRIGSTGLYRPTPDRSESVSAPPGALRPGHGRWQSDPRRRPARVARQPRRPGEAFQEADGDLGRDGEGSDQDHAAEY